jgi:hypothetical protein
MDYYNPDPYDNGTPKYSTPTDIYDALCEVVHGEEIGILHNLVGESADVSWEGQDYYYTDKGYALKTRWDKLSEYGGDFTSFDLALIQLDESEIHDIVYDCLHNDDLAKRIGFKKIFVDKILDGDKTKYSEIAENLYERLNDADRFDGMTMNIELYKTLEEFGLGRRGVYTYPLLSNAVIEKVRKLNAEKEKSLILESRAFLTSYDDFILGMRVNQALYDEQEKRFGAKVAALNAVFEEKVAQLRAAAERVGLLEVLNAEMQIASGDDDVLLIEAEDAAEQEEDYV